MPNVNKKLDAFENLKVSEDAFNHYKELVTRQDDLISTSMMDETQKILQDIKDNAELNTENVFTVNEKNFVVKKNENGEFTFEMSGKNGYNPQILNESEFKKAVFVEKKKECIENNNVEYGSMMLNENTYLKVKPADISSWHENAFNDGDEKFNFYVEDISSGRTKQITVEQLKGMMKDENIKTPEDVDKRIGRNKEDAIAKFEANVKHAAKEGVKTGFKKLGEWEKKYTQLGEELARM